MSLYAIVALVLALLGGGGALFRAGAKSAERKIGKETVERRLKAIKDREDLEHEAHQMDDASLADRLARRE